ncbi:2-(3-amino-3-carboxypropyl)histidine synthase subunit 2 isoform X1 [Sarcophilus harrisii]|uniref:2-(3-amino-3-carboxypropyl)histidine synthase subunit 2 n=2 Tax=Sarcophilus harrisii TaxID=9305 RepID=G3VYY3_SARHA|nr:2-(3-amino-3-carboxypropyl)histidine synthase subunit 2 isoform X1 [Sarcophilus harrisii]
MEDTFSSPAGAALQREAGVPEPLTPLTELGRTYELERVQAFVLEHEAKRVALQFPDELLGDSVAVARTLEEMTGAKIFVLGDTAYGSCCVDVLGAEQAEADALVHFGPACLSPLSGSLPVTHVLGQRPVALERCAEAFRALHPDPAEPVVLLSEPSCAHALEALAALLRAQYEDIVVSHPALPAVAPGWDHPPLERFGRFFPLGPGRQLEDYGAFYVGGSENSDSGGTEMTPDLLQLLLGWTPSRPFSSCLPDSGRAQAEGPRAVRVRARSHYLVERARDAQVVGLLAGAPGGAGHREALGHLRKLVQAAGKRAYVLSLGRPSPAKLANFPEVDVFVLLACPWRTLDRPQSGASRGFFRPMLTPYELEVACNPARGLLGLGPYLTHYSDLLPGSPFHVPVPPPESELWDAPDVSLITGDLRPPQASAPAHASDSLETSALSQRPRLELAESSPAASFLASRTWRGLEPQLGQTAPMRAVAGRRGVPIAYEDEPGS